MKYALLKKKISKWTHCEKPRLFSIRCSMKWNHNYCQKPLIIQMARHLLILNMPQPRVVNQSMKFRQRNSNNFHWKWPKRKERRRRRNKIPIGRNSHTSCRGSKSAQTLTPRQNATQWRIDHHAIPFARCMLPTPRKGKLKFFFFHNKKEN